MQPAFSLRLKKGFEKEILRGYPWVMRGQYVESSEQLVHAPGALVELLSARGEFLGCGTFNASAVIACRVLTGKKEAVNAEFFAEKFRRAFSRRERLYPLTYFRAVHAEADGLPGLIADRYGEVWVLQITTAGMEALLPALLDALDRTVAPEAVFLKNDSAARKLEGLELYAKAVKGIVPERIEVHENGCIYLADVRLGQKTGWYYDQRDNRALVASFSVGKTVLDAYAHSGGFGLLAAKHGAEAVTMLDSSGLALALAEDAARMNGIHAQCRFVQGDALAEMQREEGYFDIVLADPPPFVKTRKDVAAGMKAYTKVARIAAGRVSRGGLLMVSSCSHHATGRLFRQAVLGGVRQAGREAEILSETGASADHPRHPLLPQSEYLKAILLRLNGRMDMPL